MTSVDHGNLAELAAAVDKGADRLREHLEAFNGGITDAGVIVEGVGPMYELAVATEADAIHTAYEREDKRPPGAEIRETRAKAIVARQQPDLTNRYYALKGSIATGEKWLTQKRAVLSAAQSINKAGRDLAGVS